MTNGQAIVSKQGRPQAIQSIVRNYVEALHNIAYDDEPALTALWSQALSQFTDKSPATQTAYASKLRVATREAFGGDHPIIALMTLSVPSNAIEPKWKGKKPPMKQQAVNAFKDAVANLTGDRDTILQAVSELWLKEVERLQDETAVNTIITTTTSFRRAVKSLNHEYEDDILHIVTAPQDIKDQRNALIGAYRAEQRVADLLNDQKRVINAAVDSLPLVDAIWRELPEAAQAVGKELDHDAALEALFALHLLTGRTLKTLCSVEALQPAYIKQNTGANIAYKSHYLALDDQTEFMTLAPAKQIYGAWLALHNSQKMADWSSLSEATLLRMIGIRHGQNDQSTSPKTVYGAGDNLLADIAKQPMTRQRVQDFYEAIFTNKQKRL